MNGIPFRDHAGLEPMVLNRLEAEHRDLTTLERVLDWGRDRTPPVRVLEVIAQDEYTHDVVMQLESARYLVYDTT